MKFTTHFLYLLNIVIPIHCQLGMVSPENKIVGVFGAMPAGIDHLVDLFRLSIQQDIKGGKFHKGPIRAIFHGPPGNGKTFMATKIGQLSGGKFIRVEASSIVNEYQASGSQNVKRIFDRITIITQHKPVILFVDEVDQIASKTIDNKQTAIKGALRQFWCELDKHQNNNLLMVIVATNNQKLFEEAFDSRFSENSVIYFNNPETHARKNLIQSFFILTSLHILNEFTFNKVWHDIEPWFIHRFEPFYDLIMNELRIINDNQIEWANSITPDQDHKNKDIITKSMNKLEVIKNDFLCFAKAELTYSNYDAEVLLKNYFTLIDNYKNEVKEVLKNKPHPLDDKSLNDYVTKTEGLSIRSIEQFAKEISDFYTFEDNKWKVNDNKVNDLLKRTYERIAQRKTVLTDEQKEYIRYLDEVINSINTMINIKCHGIPEKDNEETITYTDPYKSYNKPTYTLSAKNCADGIKRRSNYEIYMEAKLKFLHERAAIDTKAPVS